MLKTLEDWVKQGKRSVSIKVETFTGATVNKEIWVFDYETMEGTYINDLSELNDIDFGQLKREKELETLRRLQDKYLKEGE